MIIKHRLKTLCSSQPPSFKRAYFGEIMLQNLFSLLTGIRGSQSVFLSSFYHNWKSGIYGFRNVEEESNFPEAKQTQPELLLSLKYTKSSQEKEGKDPQPAKIIKS